MRIVSSLTYLSKVDTLFHKENLIVVAQLKTGKIGNCYLKEKKYFLLTIKNIEDVKRYRCATQ